MKDSEFIELLNLYLDHEISAADALRLEAEVQNNPARRQVYQQYCRMQKACKLLTSDFQTEAAVAPDRKVVAFNSAGTRTTRGAAVYALGSLAAAACMAVILIGKNRQDRAAIANHQPGAVEIAATVPPPAVGVAQRGMAVDAVPLRNSRNSAMLVSDSRLLNSNAQSDAMLTATQVSNDQFQWLRTAQVAPLQQPVGVEELRFDVRPAMLRPEGRPLGNRPTEPATEMNAFRFVK